MTEDKLYQSHFQYLLGRTPDIARQLVDQTLAALRACSADLAMANDRNLVFQVSEAVQSNRLKVESGLAFHIQSEIESAGTETRSSGALNEIRLDELTLVDENQAEKEIEISRTVQLIDLKAEWELREMQSFSAALVGDQALRPEANPFRPAVYARALSLATQSLDLTPASRGLLLRVCAKELADILRRLYAEACNRLRDQGVQPLAYKAVTTPRRPKTSEVNVTQPGALHGLMDRIPKQRLMGQSLPAPMVQASLDHALQRLQTSSTSASAEPNTAHSQTDHQALALLTRLFEQMVKDDDLQPVVRNMIGELQPSVLRVAMDDPKILRTDQHPTWRLINEVASYANGYSEPHHAELAAFVAFLQPLIQRLTHSPQPKASHYEEALTQVQDFIGQQTQAHLQPTQQAVAELERADHRQALRPILYQQIAHQLYAVKTSESIKGFLEGPWVDVLAQTMAASGHDGEESQAMLSTVDDLIHSLQRPTTAEERDALRQALPGLIGRLQRGMASIDMPQEKRNAILDELMAIHTGFLRATPKSKAEKKAEPTPQELVEQMREEMAPDSQPFEHALHQHLMDTNVGALPTVPMMYGDDGDDSVDESAIAEWINSLHTGVWCKLFMQGQWTSAHLLWYSGNKQFFMFTSERAGRMHSMTRRALERLRAEGLATSLEDRSLMQRAVDSLLQDLDD